MKELKFNSQICTTIEQSKRLLDLGLKPETADMVYTNASLPFNKDEFHIICKEYSQLNREVNYEISPFIFIPAWSLHRLLYCLMPNSVKDYYLAIYSGYVVTYDSLCGSSYEVCKDFNESLNIYDNIVDCIEWLIKGDYLNQEYLKQ